MCYFWSYDLCLCVILLLHTKFGVNRTLICRDVAVTLFFRWRPFTILNLQNFDFCYHVTILGIKIRICTPNCIRGRYANTTLFKMAAVRHLQFSKFAIVVMRPVSERDSASTHQISR